MLRVFPSVLLILVMNIRFISMNFLKLVLERFLTPMVFSSFRRRLDVGLIMLRLLLLVL